MKEKDLLQGKTFIAIPVWKMYEGFVGNEKWILVSEKVEADLVAEYGAELDAFSPWVLITVEQFSVMIEWRKNERKHARRGYTDTLYYGVDDNYCEKLLGERAVDSSVEDYLFTDTQGCLKCLDALTPLQKQRVISHVLGEISLREISKKEGKNYTAIRDSVEYGMKKIKKYYQTNA